MFTFLVNAPWCRRKDVSQSTSDHRYEQALLWEAEEALVVSVCLSQQDTLLTAIHSTLTRLSPLAAAATRHNVYGGPGQRRLPV